MTARALHIAEPPARYHVRTPLVVDCSVLAAAIFQEEAQDQAQQQLASHDLHAPYLLQSEIANVAVKKMRQGFDAQARDGVARAMALSMELHAVDVEAVASLAQKYKLSAYDASYLWLAANIRAPLVTFDQKLATAARNHLAGLN